ncbi:MAG: DUF4340 domain-containing protein [Deltaproteobacteria bacterium]|nr:DUF4340 domain-containing protein [Deltaproteobacteria bacterium]
MKYRSTIVYLVIALLLGGLYLWDVRSEKEEKAREEEARVLFPEAVSGKLERIELTRGNETIVVQRIAEDASEDSWTITSPVETAADDFSVNRITSLLPHLKHTRIVEREAKDPASFGLENPALTLAWKTEEQQGALSVGDESPVDKDFYAMKGKDGLVFLLAAGDKEVLDKSLYDLRDKQLFTLPSGGITRLELERPSGSWAFVKSGETTWAMESEPDFPLDSEQVNTVVRRLTWEEAASFEREQADALEPYGLDRPAHRIVLSDGDTTEELLVGDPAGAEGEARRYARLASRPQVLTVDESLLEELPASLEELRREPRKDETPQTGE